MSASILEQNVNWDPKCKWPETGKPKEAHPLVGDKSLRARKTIHSPNLKDGPFGGPGDR